MSDTSDAFKFDVFISYSTKPDYQLARRLESFIESFHRTRTGKAEKLEPLQVCLDGSDFTLSAPERAASESQSVTLPIYVPEVIERHLAQCKELLVLCSLQSMRSPWVRREIEWFREHRGPGHIRLALTHGADADEPPERFFSPEIIAARLHETVWYDLRGFDRAQRRMPKVRDFDSERLRLVADLCGRSAGAIEPLWRQEQQRAARLRSAAVGLALSIVTAFASLAYVQWNTAREEKTRRDLAETYRALFSDPFTAAAAAYHTGLTKASKESDAALQDVHQVLIERRTIAFRERAVTPPVGLSFSSQSAEGPRFTKLSTDGKRVLVVTERRGDPFSPELRGEAYLLDNQTLNLRKLEGCDAQTMPYRLEFADFVGQDKVLVARAFHVELYTVEGQCLAKRSFQLRATKTPTTAAGGMLRDIFFITGNGAGCIWVEEYGGNSIVEPAAELSAVENCDEPHHPDAVLQFLVDPSKTFALTRFQSGRVDLFALDGPNGRPKRRPIVAEGGRALAFWPGGKGSSFVVASDGAKTGTPRLERWDISEREPKHAGELPIDGTGEAVDFLGFSSDGEFLIGLGARCSLHLWEYETGQLLLKRSADGLTCEAGSSSVRAG